MVELPWLVKKNRIIRQNFISVLQVMKDKTDLKMGEVDEGGKKEKKKKKKKGWSGSHLLPYVLHLLFQKLISFT